MLDDIGDYDAAEPLYRRALAGYSITGQMKVSTLQEGFLKEFGLTLRVYDGRSFADLTQTLAQVRKKKGSGKALSVAKNMKVGNLEDKFEEEFGLKVQIAGSDDSYLCKNELTLNAAQQEDEKKLARKERKSARQAEVSYDGDGGDDFIIEDSEIEGVMEVSKTDVNGVEYIYSITGQMKVSTLQEGFLKEFGLTLRVYDGRSFADLTQTLAQVRKKKGSGKALSVAKNMKVGNLEDKFEEEFGLKVQIAGSDDSYLCKNELTLNAAQQEDEKKLARKERKSARQAEVSYDGDGGDDFIIEDSEIEGVMEVSITDVNGVEHIYWVDLSKLPEDEDEYDWSIEISKLFHAKTKGTEIEENDDEENIFASEPFTRSEEEFIWVNKDSDSQCQSKLA